jgi:hypothetical protein
MYEQAAFPVANPAVFGPVSGAVEQAFSTAKVEGFLKSVDRAKLRIRDYEAILGRGLLGIGTEAQYKQLESSDQCMIRELFLSSLEKVNPALRKKFFKIYAYY